MTESFNEDCMAGMARYPDKHFELAIVDPPYMKGFAKMGYWGAKGTSIGVKRGQFPLPAWDEQIPGPEYLAELKRVSRHQIIWGINYFEWYHCPGRIVWDKCNEGSPLSNCEIASCTLHGSTRIFRYLWDGMRQAESLINPTKMQGNKKLNEKRIHPTQKPINLYRWLLHRYAKPGWKILDTHMGSQSSRIAAQGLGFDYVGFEIDPLAFASGEKRFENFMKQTVLYP